jgi:hypothetical protein
VLPVSKSCISSVALFSMDDSVTSAACRCRLRKRRSRPPSKTTEADMMDPSRAESDDSTVRVWVAADGLLLGGESESKSPTKDRSVTSFTKSSFGVAVIFSRITSCKYSFTKLLSCSLPRYLTVITDRMGRHRLLEGSYTKEEQSAVQGNRCMRIKFNRNVHALQMQVPAKQEAYLNRLYLLDCY